MDRVIITINNACKKFGIKYKSPNWKKVEEFNQDIKKLVDIYIQLKDIMSDLIELEKKYPIIKDLIDIDIENLDKIDHHLIIEVRKKLLLVGNKKEEL